MFRSTFSNFSASRAAIWALVSILAFAGLYLLLLPPVGAKQIGALAQYEPEPPNPPDDDDDGGQGPGGGGGQAPGGGGGQLPAGGGGEAPGGGQGDGGPPA